MSELTGETRNISMQNRFLNQSQQGRNELWRYGLITAGIVVVAFVAQLIFLLPAVFFEGTTDLNLYHPITLLLITMAPFPFVGAFVLVSNRLILKRPMMGLINPGRKFDWGKLAFSGLVWFALSGLSDLIFSITQPGNYAWTFNARQFIPYALLSIVLVPLQTTTEELVFRGFFTQWLGRYSKTIWLPLILPAIVFMSLHSLNPEVVTYGTALTLPFYLGIGLILGWITIRSESLELAMGLHMANNLYASMMVTFPSSSLASPALFTVKVYEALPALIVFAVMAVAYLLILLALRRKWLFQGAVAVLVLVAAAGIAQPAKAAGTVYDARQYDVQIQVQPDSTLAVNETVTYDFTGGPYDSVSREILLDQVDGVKIVSAGMDGQALPAGNQPGQVEIARTAGSVQVTWHFNPASDAGHTFSLDYQVTGGIRQDAGQDVLDWPVIPADHDYTIQKGSIRLAPPEGIAFSGQPSLTGVESVELQDNGAEVFTFSDLPANQSLHLKAGFAGGSLIAGPPDWQQADQARDQAVWSTLPGAIAAGAVLFLIALLGVLWLRRKSGGTGKAAQASGEVLSPPDDLSPLQAGYLTSSAHFLMSRAWLC